MPQNIYRSTQLPNPNRQLPTLVRSIFHWDFQTKIWKIFGRLHERTFQIPVRQTILELYYTSSITLFMNDCLLCIAGSVTKDFLLHMTLKPGDILTALYNFKGQKAEDLPFSSGEKLKVLKIISDPNWITCSNTKQHQGLVPVNHVKLSPSINVEDPWYHGKISRSLAEKRLMPCENGTFLIRSSDKFPGDYTICVKFNDVQFYHVIYSDKGYTLDEDSWFQSMAELITHYQEDADGLCCTLTKCCETPKPKLDYLDENILTINIEEIKLGPKIGCGEFSEVLQGEYRNTVVAVKCIKKPINFVEETLFTFEFSLMAKLHHPNLVTFKGISSSNDNVYIITEYMENGSLVNYLRSRGRTVIKTSDQIKFALDSCSGMCYLEEHCLVHRDLAARNILLNAKLVAKVSDFGLAKVDDSRTNSENCSNNLNSNSKNHSSKTPSPKRTLNVVNDLASLPTSSADDNTNTGNRIPVKWTAPEALTHNKYTNKSDAWSFGILLWEIFSFGRTPYPRIYANSVKQHLLNGYRMESPEDTPNDIYELMRDCWALEPEKRPTFCEIYKILLTKMKSFS